MLVSQTPCVTSYSCSPSPRSTGINRGVVLYAGTGTKDGKVGDHVLAAPPYIITEAQCSEIAVTLREALDEVLAQIAKA